MVRRVETTAVLSVDRRKVVIHRQIPKEGGGLILLRISLPVISMHIAAMQTQAGEGAHV